LNTEYPDFKHLPMESEETAEKLSLAAEQGFLNVESLSLEMARPAFTSYSGLVRKIHQGAPTDQLLGDLLSPKPPRSLIWWRMAKTLIRSQGKPFCPGDRSLGIFSTD
jgi:hypothetical protein